MRKRFLDILCQEYAKQYGADVGAQGVVHPCGDADDPMHRGDGEANFNGAWGPHVHASVPLLGLKRGRHAGEFRPLPRRVSLRLIVAVRERVQAELDRMAADLGLEPAPAVVHYSWREAGPRALHRLRYDFRSFPDWSDGASDALRTALRVVPAGLLAPAARAPGIAEWRKAIRGAGEEAGAPSCPCCEVPLVLEVVVSAGGPDARALLAVCKPLHGPPGTGSDQQGPPATGPP